MYLNTRKGSRQQGDRRYQCLYSFELIVFLPPLINITAYVAKTQILQRIRIQTFYSRHGFGWLVKLKYSQVANNNEDISRLQKS